jgi:hypothetical protein
LTGSANLAATASPATLTFTNQPVGVLSATQPVTLTNPNGTAITGIAITFTGTNGTEFTQTNNCTTTLAADSSCTINVGFTPTAVGSGTHTGQLNIADSDPSSPQTVVLMGTVVKGTPVITWATPAPIAYGTALSATQLDATASVAGAFVYTPAAGTTPTAGSDTLSVTFTPTDTADYNTATSTVTLTVNQVIPTITWATPAAITYGTALSATQLDATASVPGTFAYTPAVGATLTAGAQPLHVTFTPTDAVDYTTATATVTLTVNKAAPVITWPAPAAITYGTALSATQLDATANTPGTFVYTPAAGYMFTAGAQVLDVTFSPTDTVDYTSASAGVPLTVNKATPIITWATPAPITYLTPLSATQLDATASVAGSFVYSPVSGTVLTAGAQTLHATFTPTDAVDYTTATGTTTLTVNQATPVITWATPAAITYPTPLSATQLDATASVAGTFVYAPLAGTVPTAGNDFLTVTFTPTDAVDYATATANTTLVVHQAIPVITWAAPAAITYGTALSATQLDATASVPGTFVYTPVAGTIPTAGSQTLSVTFTPTDAVDYTSPTASVALTVNKATPVITWAPPAAITFGTALSAAQLDATANTPGTFVYTPAAGVVPVAGTQVLDVTFSPTDAADYTSATGSVTLTVNQAVPVITWTTPAAITYPTPLSATQLDATASVAGTFVYSPLAASVPTAGNDILTVTFTPTDAVDYATATANVTLVVHQAVPVVTWAAPAAIAYGTPLSATQLDATASVPGTFTYTPAAGAVLTAGSQTLNVIFTPTDAVDYTTATGTTTLTVNKVAPVITWTTPTAITYGTALSATQLDATANTPGTFVYAPLAGAVLGVGNQTLNVTFTPTDTTDYTSPATASVILSVTKATPVVTWATPAAITYGTALSVTQLDATANTPGTFVYAPAAGAVLTAGSQTLNVTFTPTDAVDYTTATGTTTLTVNKATPVVTWATPAAIPYGTALSVAQLDATASVPGTFVYAPLAGTVLGGGSQVLTLTFTPTDAVDYTTATGTVTMTVTPAVTTTAVVSSSNPSNANANVTLMATVSSAAGVPTGSVTFNSGGTPLATVALTSGTASLITAALPLGADNITANYVASANFAASTSPIVVQTVVVPNFTVAPASSAALPPVPAGQAITIPIALGPATVAGGTVVFSTSGLPPNSTALFTPANLSVSTVTQTSIMTISTTAPFPYTSRQIRPFSQWPNPRQLEFGAFGLVLAAFGLFWATTRKRRGWVLAFGGLALAAILGGCANVGSGTTASNFTNFGTPAGTYNVVVTGTDGTYQHSATVTIVVN